MASGLLNLVVMTPSSAFGTSATIPLGVAATVNSVSYITFATAGALGGQQVSYSLLDPVNGGPEIGTAIYTSSNATLTNRTPNVSTNGSSYINASSGTLITATLRAQDSTPPFSGRFSYVSSVAVSFTPFRGDLLKINGSLLQISTGGVSGGSNTSVYVNGSSNTNLASSTFYYVYAFNNSGTPTFDFRTDGNGHITDTTANNIGVEVRCSSGTNPDPTRTLIGMVRTGSASQFVDTATQNFVRSWFNEPPQTLLTEFTSTVTTTNTSYSALSADFTLEFLSFTGENVQFGINGQFFNGTTNDGAATSIGIDSSTVPQNCLCAITQVSGGFGYPLAIQLNATGLSEGYHLARPLGKAITGGTVSWTGSSQAGFGSVFFATIFGART